MKSYFRAEWGEILLVKKLKQLASDLNVTGEWAVVVRRIMNGTGGPESLLGAVKEICLQIAFQKS